MKILIISYYAFPLNAVPSYRIESFCEGFTQQGADVTLLTRHWGKTFKSWEDILSTYIQPKKVIVENGYQPIIQIQANTTKMLIKVLSKKKFNKSKALK